MEHPFGTFWAHWYGVVPPISWKLKGCLPGRWLRLHMLPDSKRYAESESEHAEIAARQVTIARLSSKTMRRCGWWHVTPPPAASACGRGDLISLRLARQARRRIDRGSWLARAMARSKKRLWGFDDGEREILVAATAAIPGLRGVVERAGQRADLQGLWVVEASVDELDEMYSLVEALMDGTRSRRRLELLEGMRMTLCTSIDGF